MKFQPFPDTFLDRVKCASDLVSIIDSRVALRKAGKDFSACCPFHNEKTPSFTVSPSKQFYHCFGCGAHGDVLSWLQEYEGLSFVEAVEKQAQSLGIPLPDRTEIESAEERAHEQSIERLQSIVAAANTRFRELLKGNIKAIEYLKSRGLTGETAKSFELGYSEPGIKSVVPDATMRELQDAGLISVDEESGEVKDRFRYRLMFPIHNERGVVIGFGGRTLQEGGKPKYLNSPEGPLFDKGAELYGLHRAKRAIRQDRTAVVLEGYMDVIMLHQHGELRAVAALGTSLTEKQVQKLFRIADEIVFCFDGDKAGQAAGERAAHLVLPALTDGKTAKFLTLPTEHDPDSFVKEYGIDAWRAQLAEHAEPLSTKLFKMATAGRDIGIPEEKTAALRDLEPLVASVTGAPVFRQALKSHIESLLSMRMVIHPVPSAPLAKGVSDVGDAPLRKVEIRPVPGKFLFYDNLATLCGLDVEAVSRVPIAEMDDFSTLIVSWFSIASDTGSARLEAAASLESVALRKVLLAAVERVEQKRRGFTAEALKRELDGLVDAITRVASRDAQKASAGLLFE